MIPEASEVETVSGFALTIAAGEPSPEAQDRWAQRAEKLTAWLLAAWRREQAPVEEMVIDSQRRSDEDGDIRRCDLN